MNVERPSGFILAGRTFPEDVDIEDAMTVSDDDDASAYRRSLEQAAAEYAGHGEHVCEEPKRDHGGDRPRRDEPVWMDNVPFERNTKRQVMSRRQNIYLALKHDPALDGLLAFDVFAQKVVIRGPVPVDDESASETGFPRSFGAIDLSRLVRYFEKNSFPRFGEKEIAMAVNDFADRVKVESGRQRSRARTRARR
jgi:hypothetical protein